MSLDEMATAAAAAIVQLSAQQNVGTPDILLEEQGTAVLTWPDGQKIEVRITLLEGIKKEKK